MAAPTNYEIGTTLAGMVTLRALGAIEPESQHTDYQEIVTLGSGLVRGMGLPSCTWHFGYLYLSQWDALKTICTGLSAAVFIATLNNDKDFKRYTAVMEMPTTYIIQSPDGKKVYMDVTINFTNLVAAE